MPSQQDKCAAFKQLHEQREAFIIPNPWDAGTARLMQGMGFKALATTSAGFAFTLGKTDGQPTLAEKLEHCRSLVAATDIPINVDFEDGYAATPDEVAENVRALIETGVAGCSIEDFSRTDQRLYDIDFALERLGAATSVARELDFPFLITARAENMIRGVRDLDDTIARLQAFEQAGADVLYAPGITSLEDLKTVTDAINRPFNVLGVMLPGASADELASAGAKRISVGNGLHSAALKPVLDFGQAMIEHGDLKWVAQTAPAKAVHKLMSS